MWSIVKNRVLKTNYLHRHQNMSLRVTMDSNDNDNFFQTSEIKLRTKNTIQCSENRSGFQ